MPVVVDSVVGREPAQKRTTSSISIFRKTLFLKKNTLLVKTMFLKVLVP